MNQILITNEPISQDTFFLNANKNSKNYLLIFLISISIAILLLFYFFYTFFLRIEEEKKANLLKDKYIVSTLYNSTENQSLIKLSEKISIIGLIDIPKINISYPILSNIDDDLLKISVCRFSGPLPNRIGNLCIAGHNYNNSLMFSKLNLLNINDSIFITDLSNNRIEYIIYDKYKVPENNLECTKNTNSIEVTLITCNIANNSERIIIKAKMKG